MRYFSTMTSLRTLAPLAALICFTTVARPQGNLANHVTIYRDTYGIPHVFGETDAATAFGFAYAQAEDNFWRIEDNYLRALGRRAEADGESGYEGDRRNRALEIPRLARAEDERMCRKKR